jgi:predicted Zn-dependent protease
MTFNCKTGLLGSFGTFVGMVTFGVVLPAVTIAQNYSVEGANPYIARKDWRGLMAYTQAWTRSKPNDPMAWYYMGQTYGTGFNQPSQAASAFRRAVALKDQWPEAWHALAFTSVQSKQYKEAVSAARKAVSQSPDRPNYWNTLASAYSETNSFKEMLDTLHEESHHMSRATSYDWYNLANGLSNVGSYQEAVTAYNKSLQMKSDFGDAWNNLGIAEAILGHDHVALQDYRRAAQLGDPLSGDNAAGLQAKIDAGKAALAAQARHTSNTHCAPAVNVYGKLGEGINYPICW